MNTRHDSMIWNFIDVGISVIVPILCLVMGAVATRIINHAERISAIESSRYTANEAKEDQKILVTSISAIKDSLHKIDKQTSDLSVGVREIKADVEELKTR